MNKISNAKQVQGPADTIQTVMIMVMIIMLNVCKFCDCCDLRMQIHDHFPVVSVGSIVCSCIVSSYPDCN